MIVPTISVINTVLRTGLKVAEILMPADKQAPPGKQLPETPDANDMFVCESTNPALSVNKLQSGMQPPRRNTGVNASGSQH
ncbi:MAG: hypothetical protein QGI45_09170 [Myxococcota bacterium]|jgi:hypothetical protein|nr:hypothetical protein [Myxococcota bacterium]